MKYLLVLSTLPSLKDAKKISEALLAERAVACVNIIPHVESCYWWKGKINKSREVMLMMKTRASYFKRLERLIRTLHPYTTPEIIALDLAKGNQDYLRWVGGETAPRLKGA